MLENFQMPKIQLRGRSYNWQRTQRKCRIKETMLTAAKSSGHAETSSNYEFVETCIGFGLPIYHYPRLLYPRPTTFQSQKMDFCWNQFILG